MSTDNNTQPPEEQVTEAEITKAEEAYAESKVDSGENDETEVEAVDPLETLTIENADLKDRFLRLAADMENLRRRSAREIKDAKTFAMTAFARDMLSVSDNLTRALTAVTAETRENADDGLKSLLEGVDITARSLASNLERHGVKLLEPMGEKFNPNFHQAMFEVPNPDVPNNSVVEVVQAGYVIGERVLRPAMVGVAKGGPKLAPNADEGSNN